MLFPAIIRTQNTELFTFPVCPQCNGASRDEDFLFSVLLSFGLNQESIKNDEEPTDPDLLALYRQSQGHFHDPHEAAHRIRLLQGFIGKDPHTGRVAINVGMFPVNQTLTKSKGDLLVEHWRGYPSALQPWLVDSP